MTTPLSRVLVARMAYLGLTKDELAKAAGLGRSTIYAFVNGTRTDPQGSTLRKLASGLRYTPAQLLQAVNEFTIGADLTSDPELARHVDQYKMTLIDLPRPFWSPYVKAIDAVSDLFRNTVVTARDEGHVSSSGNDSNTSESADQRGLTGVKRLSFLRPLAGVTG